MRLHLIPVGGAGKIIAAAVGMSVLNGDPDRAAEADRIEQMPAVPGNEPAEVVSARHGQSKERRVEFFGGSPGGVEIVLGARAVQGRRPALALVVVVDEDHLVAFAVPVMLVHFAVAQGMDIEVAADELALAFGFQDQVVAFVAEIDPGVLEGVVVHFGRFDDAIASGFRDASRRAAVPGPSAAHPILRNRCCSTDASRWRSSRW